MTITDAFLAVIGRGDAAQLSSFLKAHQVELFKNPAYIDCVAEVFTDLCKNNRVVMFRILISSAEDHSTNPARFFEAALEGACWGGHFILLAEIHEMTSLRFTETMFIRACESGHINMVEAIRDEMKTLTLELAEKGAIAAAQGNGLQHGILVVDYLMFSDAIKLHVYRAAGIFNNTAVMDHIINAYQTNLEDYGEYFKAACETSQDVEAIAVLGKSCGLDYINYFGQAVQNGRIDVVQFISDIYFDRLNNFEIEFLANAMFVKAERDDVASLLLNMGAWDYRPSVSKGKLTLVKLLIGKYRHELPANEFTLKLNQMLIASGNTYQFPENIEVSKFIVHSGATDFACLETAEDFDLYKKWCTFRGRTPAENKNDDRYTRLLRKSPHMTIARVASDLAPLGFTSLTRHISTFLD